MKSMTKKAWKGIFIALFFLFVALFAVAASTLFGDDRFDYSRREYVSSELVEMKKGESLKLSEMSAEFAEFERLHAGGTYYTRKQTTGILPGGMGDSGETGLFIDELGSVHALETGLYYITYTVGAGYLSGGYEADYSFKCPVAVFEASEEDYTPLGASAPVIRGVGSYILTEDVVLENVSDFFGGGSFYGILVNPYGYTITLPSAPSPIDKTKPFFTLNYGILDGLKLKLERKGDDSFFAFAETNRGLIRNCSVEGSVELEPDTYGFRSGYTKIFEGDGYFLNNTVRLSLTTDNDILPLGSVDENRVRDNAIYLDAFYIGDKKKCNTRNVAKDGSSVWKNNLLAELDGSYPDYDKQHSIKLMLPSWGPRVYEYFWPCPDGGKIEIERDILNYSNAEVKYWLVDGERYESLNGLRVRSDLTIEPCVKYITTEFYFSGGGLSSIYNADEELVLPKEYSVFGAEIFSEFLYDPLQVYPKKIFIPKELSPQYENVFGGDSRKFIRDFIRGGGEFVIEDGHPEIVMLDRQSLCTANGRELIAYFDDEGQTNFKAHSIIRCVQNYAFLVDNSIVDFDFSGVESFELYSLVACENAEILRFGKTAAIPRDNYGEPFAITAIFRELGKVKSVLISEDNPDYRVENGAVIANVRTTDCYNGAIDEADTLLYYPVALTGVLRVPEGVTALHRDGSGRFGIGADAIDELILPDSVSGLYGNSLADCNALKKITFGSPEKLSINGFESEVPSLEEIVFGDVKMLVCSWYAFQNAGLGIVSLPASLELAEMFNFCAGFEISGKNPRYSTKDGVLYDKNMQKLVAYPVRREGNSFNAPEGLLEVGYNAFRGSRLESVSFGDGLQLIGSYAFAGCEALETAAVGDTQGLTIDLNAFNGCDNLASFAVKDAPAGSVSVENFAFQSCAALTQFPFAAVDYIGEHAFDGTAITEVTLPESVVLLQYCFSGSALESVTFAAGRAEIPRRAFSDTPLKRVNLGGVVNIGAYAFYNCTELTEIDLSGVEQLGLGAFENTALTAANMPALASVPENAFRGCASLSVAIMPNVTSVGDCAFEGTALREIVMDLAKTIGVKAFFGCKSLETASFKECDLVGEYAFASCEALADFTGAPYTVGTGAFMDCISLTDFTVAKSLQILVGEEAFGNCTALEKLELVGGDDCFVTVGARAFDGCAALNSVSISGGCVVVEELAFRGCGLLKRVEIAAGMGSVITSAFSGLSEPIDVYLRVSTGYEWEGKVPENVTLYVPEAIFDEVLDRWAVNVKQVVVLPGDDAEGEGA